MQKPTMQNVRIRSTRDAHQIFFGVARKVVPLITRRLDAEERRAIVPGNVYVWEERGSNNEATGLGMERWTDGMGWGPSRVRDEFLFYHQKEVEVNDDLTNPSAPWAQMMSMYPSPRSRGMSDSERLIKQTYSVHVSLPADNARGISRKWHITAYFSQEKLNTLNTIDNIGGVGDILVPEGLFRSGRAAKSRVRETDSTRAPSGEEASTTDNTHSSGNFVQDPPSFSAFHSTPPDAAIQYLYPTPGSYLPSASRITKNKIVTSRRQSSQIPATHTREQYREPSIPSSKSPSPSLRSLSGSSVESRTPSPSSSLLVASKLVPLEYLQNVTLSRRDPVDEQLLRRFSTQSMSSSGAHRHVRGASHMPATSHNQSVARCATAGAR